MHLWFDHPRQTSGKLIAPQFSLRYNFQVTVNHVYHASMAKCSDDVDMGHDNSVCWQGTEYEWWPCEKALVLPPI